MADSNTTTKLIDLDNLSIYHRRMDAKKEEHSIILTLAQYNALTPEEKMNGKTYYISDAGSSGMIITASDVLMTGYSKASTASAITTNDTGSIAFGKLEKGLEDTNSLIPSNATTSNKLATASDIPGVATSSALGLVKPDGTTITVDANGVISSSASGGSTISKKRYTITASSWSNSVDANGYYTYTITLSNPTLDTSYPPNVYLAGADDSTFYTDTEAEQYSYVAQCNLTASTTLVLYANTKPDTTFYVFVEGLAAS